MFEMVLQNLLTPAVMFFVLGVIAALCKSDLKIPAGLGETLSIYLLIAIGIKGGIELSHYSLNSVIRPLMGTLCLGIAIPLITFFIMRLIKMDLKNSIGLAATFGSISVVTFGTSISYLEKQGTTFEGFMSAMAALLESPAIFVSLLLLKVIENKKHPVPTHSQNVGIVASSPFKMFDRKLIIESIFGKSVLLLLGSLFIGLIIGERALPVVKPLFIDLYGSVLIIFLLIMGLMAGERLPEVRKHGMKLLLFGLYMPLIGGTLGVLLGHLTGLSVGGSTLMGVLAGSASYIAAPAALKSSVPEANPSIYLGLALGVTFPFNLTFGIPLYNQLAQWIQ
ncbi:MULTISPECIES: sodium-dependent bicarbonate transport family permease [Bacillus]|uniref:SBT type permease sodium-bicarbonate n=2 Tax=Bacillus TaxID=1386 RepID=A0A0M4GCB0_9BACI|nr:MULTISPECIES: sodium-dependent bicarbonate transport family permease [Bacillus]ALC83520.1 SBT type permease sodium-bicarbonate [Bacillus gobiensis]MBP1082501.1 hypothetical protein [Bacillus capparidis]MED1097265.1 sodium-dependent bicarbonate transport family permease [Bacillus capparidis]